MVDHSRPAAANNCAPLLNVKAVASLLGCSQRNVYRLADAGLCPPAIKIGGMNRWQRSTLETWIADGCKAVRHVSARRSSR